MITQAIAANILASNPVILDTETTGLDNDDQIIEIAIIDHHGTTLINKLIKATKASHPMALKTHDLNPYDPWEHDIMELANRHFIDHATWDKDRSQFKRLSLAKCCELAGIKYQGNAHRAIVDCHALLDLLRFMANSQPKQASNDGDHGSALASEILRQV